MNRAALHAKWLSLRTAMQVEPHESSLLKVRADINVAPLADVVLVLLIIFMVVTPLIASGVSVELPKTLHHARKPDDGKDIIVSITLDGQIYVGRTRISRLADLVHTVSLEREKFPNKRVLLMGDARASYGTMRKAMLTLQDANVGNVMLGTEPRKAPEGQ